MNAEFAQQMLFWMFAPGMAAKAVQTYVYYPFIHRGRTPSQNEPSFRKHYRFIYITIVLSYLAYTFVQVERSLPPTLYDYIGLGRSFDEKDLKVRYRNLSMMYHPDKLLGATEEEQKINNAIYLRIRHAYDVLKDPVLRASYDKFGESVLSCSHCRTFRDHLFNFSSSYITFYTGSALFLVVLSILGKVEYGRYWRFVCMVAMAALEAKMLLEDSDPTAFLVPWRSTHERIAMLHQLFVVSSIAFSQVGPMLYPERTRSTKQLVEELDHLTSMQLKDSAESFRSAFEPFADDPRAAGELQRKMEKLAIDLRLHEDAALQTAAAHARARWRP